jgi:hypothetical protein
MHKLIFILFSIFFSSCVFAQTHSVDVNRYIKKIILTNSGKRFCDRVQGSADTTIVNKLYGEIYDSTDSSLLFQLNEQHKQGERVVLINIPIAEIHKIIILKKHAIRNGVIIGSVPGVITGWYSARADVPEGVEGTIASALGGALIGGAYGGLIGWAVRIKSTINILGSSYNFQKSRSEIQQYAIIKQQ